jgi:hypothetical protein
MLKGETHALLLNDEDFLAGVCDNNWQGELGTTSRGVWPPSSLEDHPFAHLPQATTTLW